MYFEPLKIHKIFVIFITVLLGRFLTLSYYFNFLTSMSRELLVYLPYKVMRLPLYGIVEDIEVR